MPVTATQLESAAEALRLALKLDRPADAVLRDFFHDRRALGSHDRAFIAEAVYGVLRRKRTVDVLAPGAPARRLLLAFLVRVAGSSVRDLAGRIDAEEEAWLARVKAAPLGELTPAVRAELPDWLYDRLQSVLPGDETLALSRALLQPAPLDLRVNTLKGERPAIVEALAASGIHAAATPHSPVGIRAEGRPAINRHPLFTSGAIEVQD